MRKSNDIDRFLDIVWVHVSVNPEPPACSELKIRGGELGIVTWSCLAYMHRGKATGERGGWGVQQRQQGRKARSLSLKRVPRLQTFDTARTFTECPEVEVTKSWQESPISRKNLKVRKCSTYSNKFILLRLFFCTRAIHCGVVIHPKLDKEEKIEGQQTRTKKRSESCSIATVRIEEVEGGSVADDHIDHKLGNLKSREILLPPGSYAYGSERIVIVHYDMHNQISTDRHPLLSFS